MSGKYIRQFPEPPTVMNDAEANLEFGASQVGLDNLAEDVIGNLPMTIFSLRVDVRFAAPWVLHRRLKTSSISNSKPIPWRPALQGAHLQLVSWCESRIR